MLGDWIASHKVLTSINKNLFVHAGVSDAVLDLNLSLEEINNTFTKKLLRANEENILKDTLLTMLYSTDGPVWYRGYFDTENFKKKDSNIAKPTINLKLIIELRKYKIKIPIKTYGKAV